MMLHGTLDPTKVKAVEEAREILVRMLERLNQASASGWATYPVVPYGGITKPALSEVESVFGNVQAKYIKWPATEYMSWTIAWKYITDLLNLFGTSAAFPLGDATELQGAIAARYADDIKTAPSAVKGASATIRLLLELQRAYSNLPEHPRIKGAVSKPEGKGIFSSVSPYTFIGLFAAVVVGGALIYTRKKDVWPLENRLDPHQ